MNLKRVILPPGLGRLSLLRTPKRHREDAYQQAWVAFLEGRDPTNELRKYVRHELQHEEQMIPFSQLADEDRHESAEEDEE